MLVLRESGSETADASATAHAAAPKSALTHAPGGAIRATAGRLPTLRSAALWTHRYVGLLMTVFLVVAGLTGSLLAFYHELDVALNPSLYAVQPPTPGAPRLSPLALREAAQRQLPAGLRAQRVSFEDAGVAAVFEVNLAPGAPAQLDDEYFVDPYSGRIIGSRRWGDITQGTKNIMPFVYRLHFSLALDKVGSTLFGIIALLWTIDCFVGAYLTFPAGGGRGRSGPRVWLARWKPAWLVRGARLFSWVFTWHRASGLWVWGMLLVFAWSAVGLNLREVYQPVMALAFGHDRYAYDRLPKLDPPLAEPGLDWQTAQRQGRALMAQLASQRGFEVYAERRLIYHPEIGAFRYQVESSLDVSNRYVNTTLYLDARDGHLLGFEAPTGENAGRTLTTWLYQLHFAQVRGLGLPYRVFVCLLGLAVSVLSVTGVWVWWVKRAKRVRSRSRPALSAP